MKSHQLIEPSRFIDAFSKVGWIREVSKSEEYYIWTDPKNQDVWTRLPVDIKNPQYIAYQEKNVSLLLYALNLEENSESFTEIYSQLDGYNYKLISRVTGKGMGNIDRVPYELATVITEKNIEAFRRFARTKKDKKHAISIDRFELNHTEVGSFVIPVSLLAEKEENVTLVPRQSDTSIVLHEYLDALENIVKAPRSSAEVFANRMLDDSIDSRIIKNFLAKTESITKYTEKYKNRIGGVSIGGKNSPILDYQLDNNAKDFKEIDLFGVEPLADDYIKTLEDLEVKSDQSRIDEKNANIDVIVDAIDRNGKARFTVTAINGEELKKGFRASSTELSMSKLEKCAAHFTRDGHFSLKGDIKKLKGKTGKIIVDSFEVDQNQSTIL